MKRTLLFFLFGLAAVPTAWAQDPPLSPYFVAYDHYMEEPDTLEIRTDVTRGEPSEESTFFGNATQLEYGATRWWTPELYIDWQHTKHEGSVFTGFRFENRFRLLVENHRINPVLYIEYEHVNAADKVIKEVVGFDGKEDLQVPDNEARHDHKHEIEPRLILAGKIGEWNLTGNFIGEKNLRGGPWEFGYTTGLSRLLGRRMVGGVEMYGGLGTAHDFTLSGTSHYIAPLFAWTMPGEVVLRVSPGWGITDHSVGMLLRIGVSKDIDDISSHLRSLFHR